MKRKIKRSHSRSKLKPNHCNCSERVKLKGTDVETVDDYPHTYSGVPKGQRAQRRVSILVLKKLKK